LTSDGKPYGPARYKEIVKERYIISKNCHTSYVEIGKISPLERSYIMQLLIEELEKTKQVRDKLNQKKNTNK